MGGLNIALPNKPTRFNKKQQLIVFARLAVSYPMKEVENGKRLYEWRYIGQERTL